MTVWSDLLGRLCLAAASLTHSTFHPPSFVTVFVDHLRAWLHWRHTANKPPNHNCLWGDIFVVAVAKSNCYAQLQFSYLPLSSALRRFLALLNCPLVLLYWPPQHKHGPCRATFVATHRWLSHSDFIKIYNCFRNFTPNDQARYAHRLCMVCMRLCVFP